ncbi:MAG: response regulator, partial [Flavobacteriaceae bacterium]|nr:response regulator [Flavobacteriaceae bacterium]
LYDEAPCGYVSFLSGGMIFNANKTLVDWLHYDKSDILYQQKVQDFFSISGRIFFETHFFPLIRIQGFVNEVYFDLVKKDGTKIPVLVNVKEVPAKADHPITYHATLFDITDRKKFESELIKAKQKAEAESEAKARFLSTVSHEIRTPLNAILGIGNLIHQTPLNEAQKEYARILLLSSENLLNLVNNLLDMSKLEAKKIKLESRPFDVIDLIILLENSFEVKAAEKDIDLIINVADNVPQHLLGDPVKLNQILNNLLGNSIKFTNSGSVKLEVSVKEARIKKVQLQFKVIDTGIGIPEDKLEAIFQEFSQASYDVGLEFGGTGLGLTICQRLLALYKSQLYVTSEYGKGSAFSFDIWYKLNKDHTPAVTKSSILDDDHLFDDYRILIVDDNKDNIFIASQYLQQWHVPHDTAQNGEEALEKIKTSNYDLVLLDMQMPKMNGFDCSLAIRKMSLPKQPVVVAFSASTKVEIIRDLLEAEIDDHLSKPFHPDELKELLIVHLKDPDFKKDHLKHESETMTTMDDDDHDDSSFSIATYERMANGNTKYLKKFIKSAVNALDGYAQELCKATGAEGEEIVPALIHKSTMTLYYLQATPLTVQLNRLQEVLDSPSRNEKRWSLQKERCLNEIKEIQKGLRAHLKSFQKV